MSVKNRQYHIEALVEDRSGGMIVAGIMEKILARLAQRDDGSVWTLAIRPHRGVGSLPQDLLRKPDPYTSNLLGLLPAKLKAYNRLQQGDGADVILVVLDADENDSRKLFNSIRFTARSLAPEKTVVIGLAIEELEAWVLADREALLQAYPEADAQVLDAYEQDSICGTWEVLARAVLGSRAQGLIETGYPAVGMYKAEWAGKIAPFLEPERNVSPSFNRFYKALKFVLENPEKPAERNQMNHETREISEVRKP